MESQDTKGRIVRETFPSEIVSIIGDILAGVILTLIIITFKSFLILIVIIPALLSLRGNLSGPFIARTSKDLIIGEFNTKSWIENVLSTYALSIVTACLIGISSIILDLFLIKINIISIEMLIIIPIIAILLTLSISIPTSTFLNYLAFRYGFDPNNVVNPIMTAIDDFFTVICFYFTLIMLGVP
jgi:mgtE-like transporter